MIVVLSPAKTLNYNKKTLANLYTEPIFQKEATELVRELQQYTPPELSTLMKISDDLAELNFKRNLSFQVKSTLENSKQAILTFSGTVYQGMRADEFSEDELQFAQNHIRILSGLYGILRPLDLIQPHRLEMGIKLKNPKGKDLYSFWKDKITNYLNEEINKHNDKNLINLASNEYFSAIDTKSFTGKIINISFKEYRCGTYKIVAVYAKRARGLMSRYIAENKVNNIEILKNFEEEGYVYNEELSSDNEFVFTRHSKI
ncbi:peroxide stress protein YaaA [Clostridium sp. OS1-26]|uniref:peroxide stress protein YaaA n=1 Tax=Clostridium sp. OS1-26 TaxID=3070681 RepID=UPI0027DF9876|nr:peroxide stress protein YaaA [Clostridium sp. OS1-26]WML34573.1 peroxide stress protein YaaA [Clostridium sp. OS1-26]